MKKAIKIILLQIVIISLIIPFVYAEDAYCKISLISNKSELKPGDEITINISMSNISVSGGVSSLIGTLEYPTDVFDIMYDESSEAINELAQFEAQYAQQIEQGDGEYNMAMLYMGKNDTSNSGNDWNMILIHDSSTKENGIMIYGNKPKTETQTIAKIKLKVKDNVSKKSAEIALNEIVAYDKSGNDNEVEDCSVSFTIKGTNTSGGTGTGGSGSEQGTGTNGSGTARGGETGRNNQNSNTAKDDAPFTGIEDYLPAFLIISVIGVISYINYRRYKGI